MACIPFGPGAFKGPALLTACKTWSFVIHESAIRCSLMRCPWVKNSLTNAKIQVLESFAKFIWTCKIPFWSLDQILFSSIIFQMKLFFFLIAAATWKNLIFLSLKVIQFRWTCWAQYISCSTIDCWIWSWITLSCIYSLSFAGPASNLIEYF